MASGKSKTIDEIKDLAEMFQAMAALNISCEGLTTLKEMKDRVKKELRQPEKNLSWTAGKVL